MGSTLKCDQANYAIANTTLAVLRNRHPLHNHVQSLVSSPVLTTGEESVPSIHCRAGEPLKHCTAVTYPSMLAKTL